MIDNEESVRLAEYSFSICEKLDATIRGKKEEALDGPARVALEDSERCVDLPWPYPLTVPNHESRIMRGIEQTLRRGASTPHTKYNTKRVEGHMLEIQQILATLSVLGSSTGDNLSVGEHPSNLVLVNPHDTTKTSVFESGTSLAPPLRPYTEY